MDPKTSEVCVQVVCPAGKCLHVWKKYHHAAAHAGAERTLSRIRQFFYWPGMDQEVSQFQQGCVACSLQSRAQPKAPLHPFMATYPLEVIGLDLLTLGRATDKVQNILVMTDQFTRYAWAVPTQDQTAETTARAMWLNVIRVFGCPARFHSDQGANFESSLVQQLCQLYGVSKSRTTSYHPAGNGAVERMNQTLLNMLRSLEAERQRRWPEYLPELLAAYNNTVHSSTGYAPSFLMFGRHLGQPVDLSLGVSRKPRSCELQGWVKDHQQKLSFDYKLARRNLGRAADRSKQNYDRHANAFPLVLGERVWVRDRNRKGQGKLHPGWDPEPYVVLEQFGDTEVVYKIRSEKGGNEKMMHRNSLKPCIGTMEYTEQTEVPTKTEATSQAPYYFFMNPVENPPEPAVNLPDPPMSPRRSTRQNFGLPPAPFYARWGLR
uniref:Gypsy retrotransposon integrase-like protein 1 n=1 Tax=Nothobranchius kuhntae TaxID=321403 RepID=A0A1A8JI38_NOTKU